MSRLLEAPEQKEATIRFTVDLPESTHRKLSILAAKTGRKKAEIVRALLDDLLKDLND
jgi:predicted DNA-binding protein